MSLNLTPVAVVRHVGECDIEECADGRMSYAQAVAEHIVYIQGGKLGRFASWSL